MKDTTVGERLRWSYANLAMAHAAVSAGLPRYDSTRYAIRARLYAGLRQGTMSMSPLAEDERLKMILPQACAYCGGRSHLAADHLLPKSRGGAHRGDNLVWACRSCNSAKGPKDVLVWLREQGRFPPLLLLRRYLKLAFEIADERALLETRVHEAPALPFTLEAIPVQYPPPPHLRLWITGFDPAPP